VTNLTITKFNLYHWWEGDFVSDPQWVHSNTFSSQPETQRAIKFMQSQGFKEFRVIKSEHNELDVEQFLKHEN
jgi:hypothetical protein